MQRIIIDGLRVIAIRQDQQAFRVLLGRDVLSNMVMVYNGPQAPVTLSY